MSEEKQQAIVQLRALHARGELNEVALRAALAALGDEAEGDGGAEAAAGAGEDAEKDAGAEVVAAAIVGNVATGAQARQVQSERYLEQVAGTVIFAEEGATVVVGEVPVKMSAVDRDSALGRYLHHVISHNRYLQLQGIRSGGKLVHIELDRIYIRLRTTRQRVATAEEEWLRREAQMGAGEMQRRHALEQMAEMMPVTVRVEEALADHGRLVVLGDPGSGKTTLLRYLALLYARDLAEETEQVAQALGLDEAGFLPILLPLRQIGAYLRTHHEADDGTEGHAHLLAFVRQVLQNQRIRLPDDFFDEWLGGGRAVILLDGLDEVADADWRRRVARLVEDFTRAYPGCRYVVTSRIVGYTGAARLGEEYVTTTVRDFTLADVEQFLQNWHRLVAIGQMGAGASAVAYGQEQTAQLLAAIQANPRIRELAINPLMLTVIAMVHRDRVKLPDRRAELYAEAVDVLLGKWDEARGVQEVPILPGNQAFETGDRRLMLQSVALQMHEQEVKEIESEDLQLLLHALFYEILGDGRASDEAVQRFLVVIEERTGLLVARGEGVYGFSHLTFQEYLAALAVVAQDDYVAYTLARTADPWWREVILLAAGYLSTQSKERTTRLVEAIARQRTEPVPYHNLVLAAECLRDVGGGRVQSNIEQEIQRRLRTELETPVPRGRLAAIQVLLERRMTAKAAAERRMAAAQALAQIGGELFWTMPYGEPEWVRIPAGSFWMGEGGARHELYLEGFAIARVPITNAQYHLFMQATGHTKPWLWEDEQPPKGEESHPVAGVTWRAAMAYCKWLSEVTGKVITLPSEAQWVRAARGPATLRQPFDKLRMAAQGSAGSGPARRYPWGDEFEAGKCNSAELGLGQTTPVGIFQAGASAEGCLDMAGNVWEWTRTLWGREWERAEFGLPYDPNDGREEIEAPDEVDRVLCGGAYYCDKDAVGCGERFRDYPRIARRGDGFRIVASPSTSVL